jgi:imidazolonepropionase-like amidohydrolase
VINGPAFFNLSKDFGAVANNKMADLLILDANPLANIENTQKINSLIRKGVYLDRKALDQLLADTEQKVKTKEAVEKKGAKI